MQIPAVKLPQARSNRQANADEKCALVGVEVGEGLLLELVNLEARGTEVEVAVAAPPGLGR